MLNTWIVLLQWTFEAFLCFSQLPSSILFSSEALLFLYEHSGSWTWISIIFAGDLQFGCPIVPEVQTHSTNLTCFIFHWMSHKEIICMSKTPYVIGLVILTWILNLSLTIYLRFNGCASFYLHFWISKYNYNIILPGHPWC